MDRDAERTADSPIGQRHAFTVTVGELERQLGLRGRLAGRASVRGPKFEIVGTSNLARPA